MGRESGVDQGWAGVGWGGAHWVKNDFFEIFFSFLMFLAQNQLGRGGPKGHPNALRRS